MTIPRRGSNFRPPPRQSEFSRICRQFVADLREYFKEQEVVDFIEYYDYNPDNEETKPFSIVVAPGSISPAEEPDWGTGDIILEGTIDIFVSYSYRYNTEADTCIYWAEQIFAWAQYRYVGGLGVTRPVDFEYVNLLDSDDNPDISRIAIKLSVTVPYHISKVGVPEDRGVRLEFLSINQEIQKQLLHIVEMETPTAEVSMVLQPVELRIIR